jgi:hypothetical protein
VTQFKWSMAGAGPIAGSILTPGGNGQSGEEPPTVPAGG